MQNKIGNFAGKSSYRAAPDRNIENLFGVEITKDVGLKICAKFCNNLREFMVKRANAHLTA